MEHNYASIICEYCPYTEHGSQASSMHTPNGISSCEGACCKEAYSYYVDETGDNTPLEELF